MLFIAFFLAATAASALAAVREFTLDVAPMLAAPDGYQRRVISVNGQFPGPPIYVDKGDRMVIRVRNRLNQPTSMHAHGLFNRGTPWYDGVSGVTQCPIQPDDEMTYEIDTALQAGTTWYHAHYKTEYVDGFLGPLIIRDPHDPHRGLYDEEMIVLLSDWYHTETVDLLQTYLAPGGNGNEPIPDAGLINGRGRYNCDSTLNKSKCTKNAPRETFNFVQGRRYRLRIVNTSAFSNFKFSIDGHKLTVIEADMTNVMPVTVDRLNINVAQRYSVIVQANAKVNNYWMRAMISTACYPTAAPRLDRTVLALVHYQGAKQKDPKTHADFNMDPNVDQDCVDLDPMLLRPLKVVDVQDAQQIIQLDVSFFPDANNVNRGHFNNVTFVPNFARSMLEDLAYNGVKGFPQHLNVYEVPYDKEIRIILNNQDGGEHPFHLHGYEFQVLAWEKGIYDPSTTRLNRDNPIRRDTTTVPANGFTVLQFRSNNCGIWSFHCHIDWHVMAGLVLQFQVGSASYLANSLHVPKEVRRLCLTGSKQEMIRADLEDARMRNASSSAMRNGGGFDNTRSFSRNGFGNSGSSNTNYFGGENSDFDDTGSFTHDRFDDSGSSNANYFGGHSDFGMGDSDWV